MPDPGPNEQSLELPEVSPSPPLTVARAPAPLLVPGGWRIEGLPRACARRRALPPSGACLSSSPPRSQTPIPGSPTSTAAARFFQWCETRNLALRGNHSLCRRHLYRGDAGPLCPAYRQAAPLGPPGAARLPGRGPGPALKSRPPPSAGPNTWSSRARHPVLSAGEARTLLDSIDLTRPSGLRDRALLATMVYSFARVGAVVGMNVEDYYRQGKRWWLRLHEKGGKFHQVPAHHNAEEYLDAYLEATGIGNEKGTPLWRSHDQGTKAVTPEPHEPRRCLPHGQAEGPPGRTGRRRQLPHLPGHRHHRLPAQRRQCRERPGHRRPRVPSHHQALRPHRR